MVRDADSGKYRRTRLFVRTLGYSRKAVQLLVHRSSAQIWAELHERAFRRLGGTVRGVVLHNLKEGVLTPDIYDPALNPLYRDVLAHYGVVALPCRVGDPAGTGRGWRLYGDFHGAGQPVAASSSFTLAAIAFERLNRILAESGFDAFVEGLCAGLLRGPAGPPEFAAGPVLPGAVHRLFREAVVRAVDCVAVGRVTVVRLPFRATARKVSKREHAQRCARDESL